MQKGGFFMDTADISRLLSFSDYTAADTPSIIKLVYASSMLSYGKRQKYIARHVKSNGRPKVITKTDDGYFYTYYQRRMIKRKTKEEVETELVKRYGGDNQMEHMIDEVFKKWLDVKTEEDGIKKGTVYRYETDYKRYFLSDAEHVKELVGKPIQLITYNDLERFVKLSIRAEDLTAKSFSNLRLLLRGIFTYARKHRYTSIDINMFFATLMLSKNVFRKRIRQAGELVFNAEEIAKIKDYVLANPNDIRYLGVLLGFQTGLRSGELVTLKWEDLEGDILHVRRTEIAYVEDNTRIHEIQDFTKGAKGSRDVILSKSALQTLNLISDITKGKRNGFILTDRKGRIFAEKLTYTLRRKICKELGLNPRSINKARKTYASYLKASGVSDALIEEQMGHTSIKTTEMYYIFDTLTKSQAKEMIENAIKY